MTDLAKLIERVENGSESDWYLEQEIHLALHPDDRLEWFTARDGEDMLVKSDGWEKKPFTAPKYTTSIDAVVELTEKVLEGKGPQCEIHTGGYPWAVISGFFDCNYTKTPRSSRRLKTRDPARALLSALLRTQEGE